ncbi:MAG: DUF3995 domain-containing protein [Bacteroidia bacterium]
MTIICASILFLIFLFLSSIHVYWAFGGRWGGTAVIPTKDDAVSAKMPGVIPTLLVALGLFGFGVFVLIQAQIIAFQLPNWMSTYGLWSVASIFMIRAIGEFRYVGFFKKIKHTKFAQNDSKYYSPLCLLIAVLICLVELNKK